MKETEKIEIMHFDQEGYLEDGKALYETGKKMTALADKVADEGYDAVFLMGVGGTWDELMQLEYLMNKFGDRDLEVYPRRRVERHGPQAHDREVRRAHRLRVRHHPRGPRGRQEDEGKGHSRLRHDQARGPHRPGCGRRELRRHGF